MSDVYFRKGEEKVKFPHLTRKPLFTVGGFFSKNQKYFVARVMHEVGVAHRMLTSTFKKGKKRSNPPIQLGNQTCGGWDFLF